MSGKRRFYLSVTLKLLVLAGLLLVSVPFIASLRGDGAASPGTQPGNPWNREADLSGLARGEIEKMDWPGGEVWIYRRMAGETTQLSNDAAGVLRDPDSRFSRQPAAAQNALRSLQGDYFVFLPRESIRGCQVSRSSLQDGRTSFQEPCYGARFDSSGRILRNSGRAEQQNLEVPLHEFLSPTRLRMLTK